MAGKEMPIDTFFHKITMVRDRLRVLEQKINSSNLEEQEKIDLQQYITRSYGSLTSFNVLFKLKTQQFKGQGKS
jgi:superoxide dismutase